MKKKLRFLNLLASLLIILILVGSTPGRAEAVAQQVQAAHHQSVVVLWNEVMLAAIRNGPPRPTVVARSLFMVHAAMYDAWTAYDPVAAPLVPGYVVRRPAAEQTEANKAAAVSQAAYHTLIAFFPAYEQSNQAFSRMMHTLGYEIVTGGDPATPEGIGYLAAQGSLTSRQNDGANAANNYADMTSAIYPELYQPANSADPATGRTPGQPGFDPNRWQPLRIPTGVGRDANGYPIVDDNNPASYRDQTFLTPHWGAVAPFALTSGAQFRPPPPPQAGSEQPYVDALGQSMTNDQAYRAQFDQVLAISAALSGEQKAIAEYWADGPRSETPPGHWNALAHGISYRDKHSLDDDVKLYLALNGALFDASIAAWDAKRAYDSIRPISAIRHEYAGRQIMAWAGPNLGAQIMPGESWQPYQEPTFVTPAFPEYVSGHSTFSAAAAEVLTRFTGSNRFYDGATVIQDDYDKDGVPDLLGQHVIGVDGNKLEKGPPQVVTLQWQTFQEAADEAGLSRLYGGIHIQDGDRQGRAMGRRIGEQAYGLAEKYWSGTLLQPQQNLEPAENEPFINVSAVAGVTASHRASWNEYSKKKEDFTDGYMAVGQAWGDYDNDGWPDLYVTGNLDDNVLYHNNGDGTFSLSPLSASVSLPGVMSGGAVWADYDNDGWRDLYVVNYGPNTLFHNDGGTGLTDVTALAGVGDSGKGSGAAWGDYDEDGYLDLYVVNWSCYPKCDPLDNNLASDRLYHNNGDGTFSDVSSLLVYEKLLGSGFTASFADYDNDGDVDLYVINDMLKNPIGNVFWRNDGPGCSGWCWTDASVETGTFIIKHGMGIAVGDYDNDQDLDIYFSDMVNPMVLLQNQGQGRFMDVAEAAGVAVGPSSAVGWGTAFFDYNNDGWLDLYLTTTEFIQEDMTIGPEGMHFSYPDYLFQNNGAGLFADVTPASWKTRPTPSMGFAYADYNSDGWLDFVLGNWNEGYALYRNQGPGSQGNHWLTLRLVGDGPVNRDAVGARAYLYSSDGRVQMQEVISGSSLGAGNDTALHFGLGQATVDRVKVVWPNGFSQEMTNPPLDQTWQITYQSPVANSQPPSPNHQVPISNLQPHGDASQSPITNLPISQSPNLPAARLETFADVTEAAGIAASHRGVWDMFKEDFTSGYLGIGQAWADYDNDGWLDLYVTGNLDDNLLYHNNQDGTFSLSPLSASVSLPGVNSGGAIWADYDNDGWRDLYVVNQGPNVLFHNDEGRGFTDVTAMAGVGDTGKGSGATWGDYDKDSYLDLYVVNWACYPECGEPLNLELGSDRLYHNNGDGTFSDVSHFLVHDKLLGAGFAASFVDYDSDFDLDIYVVNDALKNPIGNVLWRNDGPGCNGWCWADASTESGAGVIVEGMGLAVGDYDNDHDLDFYFSNMVNPMFLLQNRAGQFTDVAEAAGVAVGPSSAVGWGTAFFDYNNDGWQDLYLTTTEFIQQVETIPPEGMHFSYPDFLFQNNGDGSFSDVTPASWMENPTPSMGFAYADYNNDGRLDFVLGNWNQGYSLYHNEGLAGVDNHWLTIRLSGGGPINRDAVGTRVYIFTTDGRTLMQEVICGSSLGAGNDMALHFGLGQAGIEKAKIIWPDGLSYTYIGVPIDQIWEVTYGEEPRNIPWVLIGTVLVLVVFLGVIATVILVIWRSFIRIPYTP